MPGQQHLGLAIERQVPAIFGDQHIGHHRLGRQPGLDQTLGRGRLDDLPSQARQAYLGRWATITRYCAGITSSRWDVSSPITCMGARQQGQFVSSGAIVTSTRGRWAGSAPRLARRFSARSSAIASFFLVGFVLGDRLLDILQRQEQLVGVKLLRAFAEVRTLRLRSR